MLRGVFSLIPKMIDVTLRQGATGQHRWIMEAAYNHYAENAEHETAFSCKTVPSDFQFSVGPPDLSGIPRVSVALHFLFTR